MGSPKEGGWRSHTKPWVQFSASQEKENSKVSTHTHKKKWKQKPSSNMGWINYFGDSNDWHAWKEWGRISFGSWFPECSVWECLLRTLEQRASWQPESEAEGSCAPHGRLGLGEKGNGFSHSLLSLWHAHGCGTAHPQGRSPSATPEFLWKRPHRHPEVFSTSWEFQALLLPRLQCWHTKSHQMCAYWQGAQEAEI